jgi:nucleoside 2-deoxyribosyltransferase
MKIYLAGPDVFLPDALEVGRRKQELCLRHGLTGLFPLDNVIDIAFRDASMRIFQANRGMMDEADAIVANLTPFRGPSADAGTVYELGYMAGRGKLCLGYSNDPLVYRDRVARTHTVQGHDGVLFDRTGLVVEDFRLVDNLMIIHGLELHGHPLVLPDVAPADPWHDFAAFEVCLRLVAGSGVDAPARPTT